MAEIQQVKLPVVLRVVDGVDILEQTERNNETAYRDVGQLRKHNPNFFFTQFIKSRERRYTLLTHCTSSLQPIPL